MKTNPRIHTVKLFSLLCFLSALVLASLSGEARAARAQDGDDTYLITTLDFGLRISSVDRAVQSITSFAEENGGYLVSLSGGYAVFRIPVGVGEERIGKEILSLPGVNLYSSARETSDVTAQLTDLRAKLRVSQENLAKLRALSSTAGLNDLLDLERALSESLQDVEEMKGEVRYLEESSKLYTVRININGSGVVSDPRLVPIPWIRTLSLQSLLGANQ